MVEEINIKKVCRGNLILMLLFLVFSSSVNAQHGNPPLHVVSIGMPPPTIIVLHGGPGIRHNYLRPEWDRLTTIGRVIYYDQRGCGKSIRRGPYSWRQHVEDLNTLITSLQTQGSVVLAGTSWGSLLALFYTYIHPERVSALVLSGLTNFWPWKYDEWFNQVPAQRRVELYLFANRPLIGNSIVDSAQAAARYDTLPPKLSARLGDTCNDVRQAVLYSLRSAPPFKSLQTISAPTLIFAGNHAPSVLDDASEAFAHILPNAKIFETNVGHDPWFAQPDKFFKAVRRFIGSLPRFKHLKY